MFERAFNITQANLYEATTLDDETTGCLIEVAIE